ncbi:type I secretion system permease/ATPase [Tabrizicola sp.]|uniref:type I secretion system permease/ATPase n=1 Tax=Tabrizicola sp. TaxID=2005166 RepID=UPI003D2C8F31
MENYVKILKSWLQKITHRSHRDTSAMDISLPSTAETEKSLARAVQHMLAMNGLNYSEAAVRDLAETVNTFFGPAEAISALKSLGFATGFGPIDPKDISPGHCPLIAFDKNGVAATILEINDQGFAQIMSHDDASETVLVSRVELESNLLPYAILTRKSRNTLKDKMQNNWFWSSMLEGKWLYIQVIIAAMLTNLLGLTTSLFTMVVYDRVVPNEATESLIALTAGVLIALSFDFVIKSLRAQFIDRAGKGADLRMSRMIFDKILNMRLDTRQRKSGALATIVREFDTLREFFTSATLVAVVDLPFVFFFIWVIYLIAGPLAFVPLVAVPLVIITGLVIQPLLARLASDNMETSMSKQSVLVETLNGLETVQATGSGRLMRKRFEEATVMQSDLGLKNRILSQFAINSAASIQQLAQIGTIFFGVFLIQANTITMGAMIAASILGGRALAPLSQLASAMSRANGALQAYRSVDGLMREQALPEGEELGQRLSRPVLRGEIELRNVSYSFPGAKAPVISNLSLKIPAGQHVAILGKMGSGKSTLARLMAGLLQPTEGSILLDGVEMRQIDKSDLRRNMGIMLQETWLFSGSLRENIQMGHYEYDDAHILNVSKIAGVDDFVAGHPRGYDLPLRERGEGLSGGQRQSITLARALLHSPHLLILDEPTSAMDTATEQSVLERMSGWLKDRTLIAVTHRNTVLSLCDRVLVMDRGAIIADTTPERLKAK